MGGVLNIILDPLLMFVILPTGMEVTGAAVATLLSNVCAMLYFFYIFHKHQSDTVLSLSPRDTYLESQYIASIFVVGIPSALSSLISSLVNGLINKLAAGYGNTELAAVGIVKKIDIMAFSVAMGLGQGMMPLVAYNYAAGNPLCKDMEPYFWWDSSCAI